jgi:hypothetical protein
MSRRRALLSDSRSDGEPLVLRVPRCINSIIDVPEQIIPEDPCSPFFRFAPSETPVRIVHCQNCDKLVNAVHLALHRRAHESSAQRDPVKTLQTFQIPRDSPFEPVSTCA